MGRDENPAYSSMPSATLFISIFSNRAPRMVNAAFTVNGCFRCG
jgi:hypothetical protein